MQEKLGADVEVVDRGEKFDDGNYFEMTSDGKVKLRGENKQIDLSKLSKEDLKKMGIDPDMMTKEEISRKLKVSLIIRQAI